MNNKALLQARQTRDKRLMSNPGTSARVAQALQSRGNEVIYNIETENDPLSDSSQKAEESNNTGDPAGKGGEKQQRTAVEATAIEDIKIGSPATNVQPNEAHHPSTILKQYLVPLWILLAYLAAFGLSRAFYNFALSDDDKMAFDMWAAYFNSLPSNLNTIWFLGMVLNQMLSKRSTATIQNVLPGTTHAMELFERALKNEIPERHQHVERFSRYILLMWLMTARQFSKPLEKEYSSWAKIQETLGLNDAEIQSLQRKEKKGEPLALVAYDWTKVFLAEMEERKCFTRPGEVAQMYQTVYLLKKNCGTAMKFSNRELVPRFMLWISRAVLHLFGWISVLGYQTEIKWEGKSEKWYLPSQFILPYFLVCFAYAASQIVRHPFDNNEDEDMVQSLNQKIENRKRFLRVYDHKCVDDFIME
jgi:preprotein translocase subunit Sss1